MKLISELKLLFEKESLILNEKAKVEQWEKLDRYSRHKCNSYSKPTSLSLILCVK